MNSKIIRTRFAPSPTGELHFGNMRTAIIAYFMARQNPEGKFILRIDDTDIGRSKKEYEIQIKKDLKECMIEWDDEFKQSDKAARYDEVKKQLIESGRMYDCYETQDELEMQRKICMKNNTPFTYEYEKNKITDEQKKKFISGGRKPYYRFKLDRTKNISWGDDIKGELKFESKLLSDPVAIRADKTFTYLLISVVDDIDANINYVIRGEDHISNTASQIQMWEALNSEVPNFAHLALLKMPEGKISKRIGGFEIRELLNEGILPIAILNYLSKLGSSQNISEFQLSIDELIKNFDINHCSSSSPNFTKKELEDLNLKILCRMEFETVQIFLKESLLIEANEDLWEIIKNNLDNINEIHCWNNIYHNQKIEYNFEKDKSIKNIAKLGIQFLPEKEFDEKTWSNLVLEIANDNSEFQKKELFIGLRKIITGKEHGPEMSKLVKLLGLEKIRKILKNF
jgi:glutamyl-tRNA synthetase